MNRLFIILFHQCKPAKSNNIEPKSVYINHVIHSCS